MTEWLTKKLWNWVSEWLREGPDRIKAELQETIKEQASTQPKSKINKGKEQREEMKTQEMKAFLGFLPIDCFSSKKDVKNIYKKI